MRASVIATRRHAGRPASPRRRIGSGLARTSWQRHASGRGSLDRGSNDLRTRVGEIEARRCASSTTGEESGPPGELRELRKRLRVLGDLKVRRDQLLRGSWNPDLDLDLVEMPSPPKAKSEPRRSLRAAIVLILVGILAMATVAWALQDLGRGPGGAQDVGGPRWKDESATHFKFAASADFGDVSDVDSIAIAQRARTSGISFLLAIGDLGHATDGTHWCDQMKDYVPELVIGTGNREREENETGNISEYLENCPFPLDSHLVPGEGTLGYGYEYYFDYPANRPLARFIVLSPGLEGDLHLDYSEESSHTEWMEDAVEDARSRGIPWVIAASYTPCITVGEADRCSMGAEIFEELLEAEVDLLLMGRDHVYARSRLLEETDECGSPPSTNESVKACIAADGARGVYPKGVGTVVVLQGVGGEELHDVTLDGSDPEIEYFVEAMGGNANTQGGLPGFGSVFYTVTKKSITVVTDFCPEGSIAGDGRCTADSAAVFRDRFVILDRIESDLPSQSTPELPYGQSIGGVVMMLAGEALSVSPMTLTRRP